MIASNSQSTSPRLGGATGHGFMPGKSGNPKGRPKALVDIAALAREHGPKCVAVAAGLLDSDDERIRLAAATALLDRGFGRPTQTIASEDGNSPVMLHLVAVREIGRELIAEREAAGPPTIQHETLTNGTASDDLNAPALE